MSVSEDEGWGADASLRLSSGGAGEVEFEDVKSNDSGTGSGSGTASVHEDTTKEVVHRSQLKASKGISCKQCCQEHMSGGFHAATYGGRDRREREFAESRKRKEIEESKQAPCYLRVTCGSAVRQ